MSCSYEAEVLRLQKLNEEVPSDFEMDEDEDSGSETDCVIQSDHNSDTEQELSDNEIDLDNNSNVVQTGTRSHLYYKSKDGTKWKKMCPPRNVRTRQHNLISKLPGVIGDAKNAKSPLECWQLFFDDHILDKIVKYTNKFIQNISHLYKDKSDVKPTDFYEIKALFGLLYLAGVLRSNHLSIFELWGTDGTGVEMFPTTMALRRFRFLLRCLRFDDLETRADRKSTDNLAAIREVFQDVNQNFGKHYSVGNYTTIDEMLWAFRGRCSFRMYMPNKPARYGIKVFSLTDARTYYTLNMEVYVGKQPDGEFSVSNTAKSVVERLCEPIYQSCRNITIDNWFTSVDLALTMLNKHKLTILGTLRKNKPQVPAEFVKLRRPPKTSMFGFTESMTLVSYIPKRNKTVLLLSTMHHDDQIDESTGDENKPEMITLYNVTKGGVDSVDQLCSTYNVARRTRRWPMTIFYGLLNVAAINGFIIYKSNNYTPDKINEFTGRRIFLKELAKNLIVDYMKKRVSCQYLPREIRRNAARLSGVPFTEATQQQENKRGRCAFCKDRKTRFICQICKKFICLEHSKPTCPVCTENLQK